MKAKRLEVQIQALRENLRKAEARLEAAKAEEEKARATRVQAAIDGKTIGPRDRRELDEAGDLVATLTEALARAEADHADALREGEAEALRASLKASGKKVSAAEEEALEALSSSFEALSRVLSLSGAMERTRDRLASLGASFEEPPSYGRRPDVLFEAAAARTWNGKATTYPSRFDVTLELHPGDFPAN